MNFIELLTSRIARLKKRYGLERIKNLKELEYRDSNLLFMYLDNYAHIYARRIFSNEDSNRVFIETVFEEDLLFERFDAFDEVEMESLERFLDQHKEGFEPTVFHCHNEDDEYDLLIIEDKDRGFNCWSVREIYC